MLIRVLLITCLFGVLSASQVEVSLDDPSYIDGVVSTKKGGFVRAQNIYVQAHNISYTEVKGKREVHCRGDIMVDYGSRIYIGEEFFYDFIERKGYLIDGRTSDGLWIIGADRIDFEPDNSATAVKAFVTTSEDANAHWDFHAKKLQLKEKHMLHAEGVSFRFNKVPVMYLPWYTQYLGKGEESAISYNAKWETGQGPKIGLRYRIYSTETFSLYARADLRLRTLDKKFVAGGAGAIETVYRSKDKKVHFSTRNWANRDTFINDPKPNEFETRYRLQGLLKAKDIGDRMQIFARWDRISDKYLPGDFPNPDFELRTSKRTELKIDRNDDFVVSNLYIRPKINGWQGFMQELPTAKARFKPLPAADTGIVFNNNFRVAYLDYEYSGKVTQPPGVTALDEFKSARLQTTQTVYRPFHTKLLTVTPLVGFTGIFYSRNQNDSDAGLAILRAGGTISTQMHQSWKYHTHVIEPQVDYYYIHLAENNSQHYIFSLGDGWKDLNYFRASVKHRLYFNQNWALPSIAMNFYSYGFLNAEALREAFPRIYATIEGNYPRISLRGKLIYNFQHNTFETVNAGIKWSISDRFALSGEFRHRNKWAWKKCDYDNFTLDATRSQQQLLESPLSDPRNVFLLKSQLNLTPFTTLRAQGHFGWGRSDEPAYQEATFDILTMITDNWRLRVSYLHTVNANSVSVGLSLIPIK